MNSTNTTPRSLTHDEKKAAEAAFRGLPSNPHWSSTARHIYDGIVGARGNGPLNASVSPVPHTPSQGQAELGPISIPDDSLLHTSPSPERTADPQVSSTDDPPAKKLVWLTDRIEAIKAGALIDVSTLGEKVGLTGPISMSRSLWERTVGYSNQTTDDTQQAPLRDLLLAFRLRVAVTGLQTPTIPFLALLVSPNTPPRVVDAVGIVHQDSEAPYAITLVLPQELQEEPPAAHLN